MSLDAVAELDGYVDELLEGTYPDVRRDCVLGPEEVIREAAREQVGGAGAGER
jgi:cysteine desulfurase/selenocysteine lyase